MRKSYKKFLAKADPNIGLDRPISPIKVGESSSEQSNEPKSPKLLETKQTVATVGPMASTAKGVGRSNIHRSSWPINQMTEPEAIRLNKSMNDKVQKEYNIHGFDVCVEWPAGQPRMYGKDNKNVGKTSVADYGFFKGTISSDGGGIDAYIGPNHESKNVYLLSQKPTSWDIEHGVIRPEEKWMLGFGSIDEAEACYKASMPEEYFLSIGEVSHEDFLQTINTAKTGKTDVISKSVSWREDFKNVQSELKKYLEGEQSATANEQTSTTAEFSPEPDKVTKSSTRYIKRQDLAKRLNIAFPTFKTKLATVKKKQMMKSLLTPTLVGDEEVRVIFNL